MTLQWIIGWLKNNLRRKTYREKYIKNHDPLKIQTYYNIEGRPVAKFGWFGEGIGWERIDKQ